MGEEEADEEEERGEDEEGRGGKSISFQTLFTTLIR